MEKNSLEKNVNIDLVSVSGMHSTEIAANTNVDLSTSDNKLVGVEDIQNDVTPSKENATEDVRSTQTMDKQPDSVHDESHADPNNISLESATILCEDGSSLEWRNRVIHSVLGQPTAFFKHQQRGEDDIDDAEKKDIVEKLLKNKPYDFLKRLRS